MKSPRKKGVIVVGGGLAGLISAILMAGKKIPVYVVEKKTYPFHRVCGEYISNETRPFLVKEGLFPGEFSPPEIKELQLTSVSGKSAILPLDVGGFGISRFAFDNFLYEKARVAGVRFLLQTEVTRVTRDGEEFEVEAGDNLLSADVVLAAFGKRSKMDHALDRRFIRHRSPYAAVKYHIQADIPLSRISLHNFNGGYCGISRIEAGVSNLCYLTHADNLKNYKSIPSMEELVLFRNPFIRQLFRNAKFVMEKPEVISEISFETKSVVENGILMAGDAAGMITPLCGNGMAMAIHSASTVSGWISKFIHGEIARAEMEAGYRRDWNDLFARRLWIGRRVQALFGSESASNLAVNIARYSKPLANWLVRSTLGETF